MIKRLLNKLESIYKYRYFSKNEKGAYNFLLKKIYKSTDINFIEKIWQLDYFKEVIVPEELNIDAFKKVLILAPHQDDEVIGCGGTLAQLKEQDCNITIGFLTDGAELSNPKESIQIRKNESSNLCNSLNATKIDFNIDNVSLKINQQHLDQLTHLVNRNWDAIFTVWPLDNPPKHRLCSYLIGKTLKRADYKGDICFYGVHTDVLPNFYVNISKEIDKKEELIKFYPSQLKHQNYLHLSKGLDAWRTRFLTVSPTIRYIETFMKIPVIAYQDFQEVYNQVNTSQLFKANEACIRSFKNLNKLE